MDDLPPLSVGEALAPGDANDHVLALQQRLAEHGYFHDSLDGVYGESTEAAVRELQRERGLIEDGVVGERTWEAAGALGAVQAGGYADQAEEYREPDQQADPAAGALQTGDVSEDGHWRWNGEDWVPAHQTDVPQAETEHPAAEHPAVEQPAAEHPAAEQPAAELLAAEQPAAETGPGVVSEDGQWVWDGEQWRPNQREELTPELFQEVIAQSIQVTTSGTA